MKWKFWERANPTDKPTAVESLPDGSYSLGLIKLRGQPTRAFWLCPLPDQESTILTSNIEGNDLRLIG